MRKILTTIILIISIGALAACSSGLFSVHKIDVQQGNALPQKNVKRVQVGMNKQQVQYLLGSPLVTGLFRENRWDYLYYFKPGDGQQIEQRITLYFEDDIISRIDTPDRPDLASRERGS